ncbi:MAG: hypothetical protein ACRCYB_12250 [Aeromonas veronii]
MLLIWVYFKGYVAGVTDVRTDTAQQANTAWVQRFTLESQLATRDAQLAEAQQAASAVRTETITKREVIYRDRIKVRTVRDCVNDSGVWQLYNSTLGVTGGQQ